MTDLVTPAEVGGAIDPVPMGHALENTGTGSWVIDGVELADSYSSLDSSLVNGFAVASTSGLDMTIDGGEAYVGGWLCRDRQTTYTFNSSTSTTLCVGYDSGAVLASGEAPADSENIIVGTPGDFGSHDPYIELYDIETDADSITYTDVRVTSHPGKDHFQADTNPHKVTPAQIGAYTQNQADETFLSSNEFAVETGERSNGSGTHTTSDIYFNNTYDVGVISVGIVDGPDTENSAVWGGVNQRYYDADGNLEGFQVVTNEYGTGVDVVVHWEVMGIVAEFGSSGSGSTVYVDDYERSTLGDSYWIADTGQATLPDTSTTAAYSGTYGFQHPDGNPNTTVSLASDNPAYDSNKQPATRDNYPGPNKVLEFFFKPVEYGTDALSRFCFNSEEYGRASCLRLHLDPSGYWRVETVDSSGSWDYYGTDPQEDSNFSWDVGSWHRVVIDMSIWPDVSVHLWNAETGSHKSSMETSGGSGGWNNDGYAFWANDWAHCHLDLLNLIDSSDYTAGQDM